MSHTTGTHDRTGPSRRTLLVLAIAIALVHLALLLGVTGTLDWSLQPATTTAASPLKTRMIAPPAPAVAAVRPAAALVPKAPSRPVTPPVDASAHETNAEPSPSAIAASSEPSTTVASAEPAATPAEAASAPQETAMPGPAPTPATASWPTMALGALPPSSLMSYQMTGMDKGFTYYASGELRWQHNPQAYALSVSVKAFLIGIFTSNSKGQIDSSGLSPLKFSETRRSERATHFDREQKRIVFSSNAPVATLLPGAQDQISLYMQLASAMAGDPDRYPVGTRLQVQTATLRDAVPWLLILEGNEPLNVSGQTITASKWVCQPRSQYDAKVEIWLSQRHNWMPARIRITQVSGSFIDMNLRGMEALPPLPAETPVVEKTTSS